jgi:hypothetical protein
MRIAVIGGTGLVGGHTISALAELATGEPLAGTLELGGPENQDAVDMARRALAAHRETVTLVPSWCDGPFGVEMAGEVLLPKSNGRVATTTFDAWLEVAMESSPEPKK